MRHRHPDRPTRAAGFVRTFWSTTRLLMIRGWLSITVPADCSYDVAASALRKTGFVSRGKTWSADPSSGCYDAVVGTVNRAQVRRAGMDLQSARWFPPA